MDLRDEPLSVLLPVRDGAAVIGTALRDLATGLGPDDELLVIDDGSRDGTPGILDAWQKAERRIRVVAGHGTGLVDALNRGLREAQYQWIARADADDRYPANRLAVQRAARSQRAVAVVGDYRLIAERRVVGRIPCALGAPFVAASLINPQRVPHPGILFRRDAVEEAGGYRREDFPAEDLGLWLRLMRVGDFVGVPSIVVDWTMAHSSTSHSRQNEQRRRTAELLEAFPIEQLTSLNPDDVRQELRRYGDAPDAGRRRVLLLRDLRTLEDLGLDARLRKVAQSAVVVHAPSSAVALGGLALEARRRVRFRTGRAA